MDARKRRRLFPAIHQGVRFPSTLILAKASRPDGAKGLETIFHNMNGRGVR